MAGPSPAGRIRSLLDEANAAYRIPQVGELYPILHDIYIDKAAPDLMDVGSLAGEWARAEAGVLVRDIGSAQRTFIQRTTAQAMKLGWTDAQLAERLKGKIGLTVRQQVAVDSYLNGLLSSGIPPGQARAQARDYAKRLRAQRAAVIARTEAHRAELAGMRAYWRELIDTEDLPLDAKRRWVLGPGEEHCPACVAMAGTIVPVTSEYRDELDGPPLHPNCRCIEVLDAPTVVRKVRHVRTPEGARYYNLPIGAPIRAALRSPDADLRDAWAWEIAAPGYMRKLGEALDRQKRMAVGQPGYAELARMDVTPKWRPKSMKGAALVDRVAAHGVPVEFRGNWGQVNDTLLVRHGLVLADVDQLFPGALDGLRYIELVEDLAHYEDPDPEVGYPRGEPLGNAQADYNPGRRRIRISNQIKNPMGWAGFQAGSQAAGWHVPGVDADIYSISHELGHHLAFQLDTEELGSVLVELIGSVAGEARAEQMRTLVELTRDNPRLDEAGRRLAVARAAHAILQGTWTHAEWQQNISGYAETSGEEMLAELFAEWYASPNPRPAARLYGEALQNIWRRRTNG